jgi:hypothetical protein
LANCRLITFKKPWQTHRSGPAGEKEVIMMDHETQQTPKRLPGAQKPCGFWHVQPLRVERKEVFRQYEPDF